MVSAIYYSIQRDSIFDVKILSTKHHITKPTKTT